LPLTLVVPLLLAIITADDNAGVIGNEPKPLVLVLGEKDLVEKFKPLADETFGKDGKRTLDYEFANGATAGLVRRKIDEEREEASVIPLGLGAAVADGRPCVVLEMDKVLGTRAITKGVGFSLRVRAVEPNKLREKFGPGVYEGLAWLRFVPRNATDAPTGVRKHLLRLRLAITGRRLAVLSVGGTAAVGQRVKVTAAVEEVVAGQANQEPDASRPTDRLRVEFVPEREDVSILELPWPVPPGAWDPRNVGPKQERATWIVPKAWLDEPILIGDAGSRTELLVDQGPVRSVVHRQSVRLPPLFAPGNLTARIVQSGVVSSRSVEVPIRSGLLAGPSLAFLNERIYLRAVLALGNGNIANPPETIKVRIDPPSGQGRVYVLPREGRSTGYASYALKSEDQPRILLPGYYRATPANGNPELDEALGREVVIQAALKIDDDAMRRERVAFLGATPIHWPLIVWLDAGRKDGSLHRAETRGAIQLKSVRGPEEIGALSLSLSMISAPSRQDTHDNVKDGVVRFNGPGKTPQGPWSFDQTGISLDLIADIDSATKATPALRKGARERSARFIVEGIGPDKERIGRIFREPCTYIIAAHWDYYLEWAWIPGLIVLALLLWWYFRSHGGRRAKKAEKRLAAPGASRPAPGVAATGEGRFGRASVEPETTPKPATPAEPPRRGLSKDPGPPSDRKKRF
jgi:hypothetical protein